MRETESSTDVAEEHGEDEESTDAVRRHADVSEAERRRYEQNRDAAVRRSVARNCANATPNRSAQAPPSGAKMAEIPYISVNARVYSPSASALLFELIPDGQHVVLRRRDHHREPDQQTDKLIAHQQVAARRCENAEASPGAGFLFESTSSFRRRFHPSRQSRRLLEPNDTPIGSARAATIEERGDERGVGDVRAEPPGAGAGDARTQARNTKPLS